MKVEDFYFGVSSFEVNCIRGYGEIYGCINRDAVFVVGIW